MSINPLINVERNSAGKKSHYLKNRTSTRAEIILHCSGPDLVFLNQNKAIKSGSTCM